MFTDNHVKILKRAASYPEVERVLVHPAIKKALCEAAGTDRAWLGKVRPIQGHHYHFHIRIGCPPGSKGCVAQKAVTGEDGCKAEVDGWLKRMARAKLPRSPQAAGLEARAAAASDDARGYACRLQNGPGKRSRWRGTAAGGSFEAREGETGGQEGPTPRQSHYYAETRQGTAPSRRQTVTAPHRCSAASQISRRSYGDPRERVLGCLDRSRTAYARTAQPTVSARNLG